MLYTICLLYTLYDIVYSLFDMLYYISGAGEPRRLPRSEARASESVTS